VFSQDKYMNAEELNKYLREEIEALLLSNEFTNNVLPFDFSKKPFVVAGSWSERYRKNNYYREIGGTTEKSRKASHVGCSRYV